MSKDNNVVKYSICITCRNEVKTVRKSLDSILYQIDDRFEIVVVDSFSDDGTLEILLEYARMGKLKLLTEGCSRGRGRQIAFENSSGDYIIANIDMDDVFRPLLSPLLELYTRRCEGNLLLTIFSAKKMLRGIQNITILPRSLLFELGGWRDLQYFEDWDLWSRAAKIGKYRWTEFPLLDKWNLHPERRSLLGKMRFRYLRYRDLLRLGVDIFSEDEDVGIIQKVFVLMARIGKAFSYSYEDPFNKTFNPYDKTYQVQF